MREETAAEGAFTTTNAGSFFGAWADKKGAGRVVAVSGLLFAGGLALTRYRRTLD